MGGKSQVESTQKLKQAEDWAVTTIVKWSDVPEQEARRNVRAYVTEDLTQQLSNIKVEDIVGLGTNVVGRVTSLWVLHSLWCCALFSCC